jgi:hypothetical protein
MFDHPEITGREQHPTIKMPSPGLIEGLGPEDADAVWASRKEAIVQMLDNPLSAGYESPSWKRADRVLEEFRKANPVGVLIFLVLGGHRAGKTCWRAKRTVQALFNNANYKVWACQATQEASREAQQLPIYTYLPPEYKVESGKLRKGRKLKVNYSPWGGFTEDVFAVQNVYGGTSECRFKFYSMDPKSLEGAEIDQAWCDEEATLEWLEACLYRLVSRNGILFLTFTPRWGYTQTVKAILNGAVTLEEGETDTELIAVRDEKGNVLAAKKVPLVQENAEVGIPGHKVRGRIVYFHSADNPFPLGNWENMKATLKGASEDKILTTTYGVPTQSLMSQFPMFKDLVHVVSLNRFREIQKGGGVWYMFLDPAAGKNWFMAWIFCDPLKRAFVAAEFPSTGHDWAYVPGYGDLGPWAVPGKAADGDIGDGQKEIGWGYTRYLEEIDRMERLLALPPSEEKIKVDARWIDSRYGNARRTAEERATTLIEDLADLGMDFLAAPAEKYIDGGRGGGDGSLRMINDLLYYDQAREIDLTNSPKLFCVETVPNVIWSLHEWRNRDGGHSASKDPVDILRMFVLSGAEYVSPEMLRPITPWLQQFSY